MQTVCVQLYVREPYQSGSSMNVFVIMRFDEQMDTVYRDLTKSPLERAGFRVSRADDPNTEFVVHENIYDRIVQHLWDADFIVADLTKFRPNVFYELGIAHTLNKRTIQISQKLDKDIPFDIKSQNVISYEVSMDGSSDVSSEILEVLNLAQENRYIFSNIVDDFVRRTSRVIHTDPPARK